MSNSKQIIKFIKDQLKAGTSKTQIASELASNYEPKEYERFLKDFPEPELKAKYKTLNQILIACIAINIPFKLLAVFGLELAPVGILIFCLMSLVISVCLILYLSSFRAMAYLVTFLLTMQGLGQLVQGLEIALATGNVITILLASIQTLSIILVLFLSIFLWKKVHPGYKFFSK